MRETGLGVWVDHVVQGLNDLNLLIACFSIRFDYVHDSLLCGREWIKWDTLLMAGLLVLKVTLQL